jgi:signal transduction histidine kinase
LERAAAAEERARVARDLHDGLLQTFTGVGLRLAAARALQDVNAADAARELERAQQLLAQEQRDLRVFVEELLPAVAPHEPVNLQRRLEQLAVRVSADRNLEVRVHLDPSARNLASAMAREVYLLVREAVLNAIRHGEASRIDVSLCDIRERPEIRIQVADNGRGFPFAGTCGSDSPLMTEFGPRTVRERVDALRGRMHITSQRSGALLDIVVPLAVQ